MTTLADFYSDLTTPEMLTAGGFDGGSFYVSHQAGKTSTPGELLAMRIAGKIVALNFEDSAAQSLNGYSQGVADGTFARDCGLALGYPAGDMIFFSVDFDCQPDQIDPVIDYFRGVRSVIAPYTFGPYGSIYVLNMIHAALGLYGWQARAWSGDQISPYAALYQDVYGQQFDSDRLEFNVPLWGLDALPTKAAFPLAVPAIVTPPPPVQESAMIHFAAHGRDHLFNVQANGDFVWRAHSPGGTWQMQVLATGAKVGSTPAAWLSGTVPPAKGAPPDAPVSLYLQISVELADGGIFQAWTAPGGTWLHQVLAAA